MKLIILSDLFGNHDVNWIDSYLHLLKGKFDIHFYDSRELAEIDLKYNEIDHIHNQFLNGGIEKAVKNLLLEEKDEISILGFSIGGLIGWKAILSGLNANYICAVSSTRLRFENQKPNIQIDLFFAENDPFKPHDEWFEYMKIDHNSVANETHEFYRKQVAAEIICNKITKFV